MATLNEFAFRMNGLARRLRINRGRIEDATARRVLVALVEATPVDTGAARSNWLVGRGRPRQAVIPPYAPGKKLGRGERRNASAAISAGFAAIRQFKTRPIFVGNNLDYIEFLNDGTSKQAPAGFVERAIIEGQAQVRRMRLFRKSGFN